MQALEYNLKKIAKCPPRRMNPEADASILRFNRSATPKIAAQPAEEQAEKQEKKPKIYRAQLPEHLQLLYDANTNTYKKISSLHKKMKELALNGDQMEASVCREEILSLEKEVKSRWITIEKGMADVDTPKEQFNEFSYRSYICKNFNSTKPEIRAKVLERVNALLDNNFVIKEETLQKLRDSGILQ